MKDYQNKPTTTFQRSIYEVTIVTDEQKKVFWESFNNDSKQLTMDEVNQLHNQYLKK